MNTMTTTTTSTPGPDRDNDDDRRCTTCGKSVEDLPYEYWLFHTCRPCAAEMHTRRWGDGYGTERKWCYSPRWHLVEHPARAENRARLPSRGGR